ncbi:unnamed protein product [Dovyalis caffra]|uniref:Uncharacterized protein n=1 Tax=Dovyalis caffra TaxID=77055 RepID=A0AAV1RKH3_9ROSI|nr:unnamed protein product [Dovyalis caffra]
MPRWPLEREYGWMEIEMGEFYSEKEGDENIVFIVLEVDNHNPKHGIVIEGIELKPKDGISATATSRNIILKEFSSFFLHLGLHLHE